MTGADQQSNDSAATSKTRVCAILYADMVGYSRLLRGNDAGAVQRVIAKKAAFEAHVRDCGGTVVHAFGDNVLCHFESAAAAVNAAVLVQTEFLRGPTEPSGEPAIAFRIGISTGEVYETEVDLHGHEVNVAARLQDLIAPGEICVTQQVYDDMGERPALSVRPLGEVNLWNLGGSIAAYGLRLDDAGEEEGAWNGRPAKGPSLQRGLKRPYICVYPLQEMGSASGDLGLGKMISDELVSTLSQFPEFSVLSFAHGEDFRNAPRKLMARVGEGSGYLLDGSIGRKESGLRINVSLRDAESFSVIWAGRYNYTQSTAFDFLDQVAREVGLALQTNLTEGDQAGVWAATTRSFEAWELYQRAQQEIRRYRPSGHLAARRYLDVALDKDPDFLAALVLRGFCGIDTIQLGWAQSRLAELEEAKHYLAQATRIDPDYPECLSLEAYIAVEEGEIEQSVTAMNRAVELAPQNSELIACRGTLMTMIGDFDSAIESYQAAMDLTPHVSPWIPTALGLAFCLKGDLAMAEETLRQVNERAPDYIRAYATRAVTLVRQGRTDEAHGLTERIHQIDPSFDADAWTKTAFHIEETQRDRLAADFKQAVGG